MLSVQITDIKRLTALLFTEDAFDKFMLREAQFMTAVSVEIDGLKNKAFFAETEQAEELKVPCVLWADYRPICLKLISGKRLPVSFKIVLQTPKETTDAMKAKAGFTDCEVSSLSINLSYRESVLMLTTGIAYSGFTMDKSLEKYWDETVLKFLNGKDCTYESIS